MEEIKRQRKLVKEQLYPFFLDNCESVEGAKLIAATLETAIRQSFNNQMTKQKVAELKLSDYLIDDEKGKKYGALLELLKEETIVIASSLLQGFCQEVDKTLREENLKRPLRELPIVLLD